MHCPFWEGKSGDVRALWLERQILAGLSSGVSDHLTVNSGSSLGSCLVLLLSVGLAVLAAISPLCRVVVRHPGAAALALASTGTGYLCREAKERGLLRRVALLCFLLMTKGVRDRQKNCTRHWFSYLLPSGQGQSEEKSRTMWRGVQRRWCQIAVWFPTSWMPWVALFEPTQQEHALSREISCKLCVSKYEVHVYELGKISPYISLYPCIFVPG